MSAWPAVDNAIDALGRMRPDELAHGVQVRFLHQQLSQVLAIAQHAVDAHGTRTDGFCPRSADMADLVAAELSGQAR